MLAVAAAVALGHLGLKLGALATLLAAFGLAMGFALQGSLSHFAAGIMLAFFRPFKIGDEIEVSEARGQVLRINLMATSLRTVSNTELIVANGDIWGANIKNFYGYRERRLDMTFDVAYDTDISQAIKEIIDATKDDDRLLNHPEPVWAKVVELADSSIKIELRVFCQPQHYRRLRTELPLRVMKNLTRAGISIPYPHEIKIVQKAA